MSSARNPMSDTPYESQLKERIAELEQRIAKAIEIAGSMKSLDAHRRLMEVLEGE